MSAGRYRTLLSNSSNGYLRGIKIDSVKPVGDTIIYYPSKTRRGDPNFLTPYVDTGGSWVGSTIRQYPNGTCIFDNIWGNTITIHTQDTIGSHWLFCTDSTTAYYDAEVTNIDTMAIFGTTDTVKSIKITAYKDSAPDPSNYVNGFVIKVSKNHGFVQLFDFYLFPYHSHHDTNCHGIDYYLDQALSIYRTDSALMMGYTGNPPDTLNSIFRLVSYHDPTALEIYNFNCGDYFMNASFDFAHLVATTTYTNNSWQRDSIAYRYMPNPYHVTYGAISSSHSVSTNIYSSSDYSGTTTDSSSSYNYADSFSFDSTTIYHLADIPESLNQPYIFYFLPNDTSYCYVSAYYAIKSAHLLDPEYCADLHAYKSGIGKVYAKNCVDVSESDYPLSAWNDSSMAVAFKGLSICSSSGPLVEALTTEAHQALSIFPNPATNRVYIKGIVNSDCSVSIYSITGKQVYQYDGELPACGCDVSDLTNGIYIVVITSDKVSDRQKLIIAR